MGDGCESHRIWGQGGGTTCDFITSRIMRTLSQHWIPQAPFPKAVSMVSGKTGTCYFLNLEVALIPESEEKTRLSWGLLRCLSLPE